MPTKAKTNSTSGKERQAPAIPAAEWVASAIGLILVVTTIGFLAYVALTQEQSPPDLRVEVVSTQAMRNGYLVLFEVTNQGHQTAAEVQIRGEHRASGEPEEAESVIDYVPPGSRRRGGLTFATEPDPASLKVRALGYREP